LEILQTYQRESKPIQDVYGQVTRLFHQAPDLLEDFKQFLPESAAHAKAAAQARQQAEEAAMLSNVRGETFYPQGPQPHQTPRAEHRLPPVGNFAPTPTVNKDNKRKRGDRQGTAVSGMGTIVPETGNAAKPAGALSQSAGMNKVSDPFLTGGRCETTLHLHMRRQDIDRLRSVSQRDTSMCYVALASLNILYPYIQHVRRRS